MNPSSRDRDFIAALSVSHGDLLESGVIGVSVVLFEGILIAGFRDADQMIGTTNGDRVEIVHVIVCRGGKLFSDIWHDIYARLDIKRNENDGLCTSL